ncbi:unnamed protein product [Ranitomeya imitator]|uniref:Uncharacterized protein n=1 Tax=Ranitomeya imitator TaxID=111125 RepID=A0ABN9LK25_9NEOB|nr:unnamed protein product [Ranitomeya imitator]
MYMEKEDLLQKILELESEKREVGSDPRHRDPIRETMCVTVTEETLRRAQEEASIPPATPKPIKPRDNVGYDANIAIYYAGWAIYYTGWAIYYAGWYRHTIRFTYDHDQRYDLAVIVGYIGGLSTAFQNAVDKPLMPVALAHLRFWGCGVQTRRYNNVGERAVRKQECEGCCSAYARILQHLERRAEAEQRLREEELALRREELQLQRERAALERERQEAERKERERRFELEREERQVILEILREKMIK